MQKKYTVQELERLSIFDVRALAKDYGVTSPTKHNKAELVDLIYKISNGLMEPPQPPRHGRPPKNGRVAPIYKTPRADSETDKKEPAPAKDDFIPTFKMREVTGTEITYSEERHSSKSVLRDDPNLFVREGYLEVYPENYGFLRVKPGECNEKDAYVGSANIRKFGLRRGDYVVATCKKGIDENKPAPLIDVISINGDRVDAVRNRPNFDHLTPIYPNTRLRLEVPNQPREYAMRCIDLVSPIGKGQRGIIVSPPKAGKTTLLKMIAGSITKNYPDVVLKVLLIDERPEEVTDMQRSINGEVVYSTFDELPEHHTKTAEMLLERCKRIVETGKDVVILLDSLTRLARAYNLTIPPTGRTLSGGLDPGALHSPKRFFGSARNLEANEIGRASCRERVLLIV